MLVVELVPVVDDAAAIGLAAVAAAGVRHRRIVEERPLIMVLLLQELVAVAVVCVVELPKQ